MSTGMGIPKDALLAARNVVQEYALPDGRRVRAVSDVSFDLGWGENLAIVGETASGKTTLARTLVQAPRPRSGAVFLLGHDLTRLRGKDLVQRRRHVQMVFQDPYGSLNPRSRVSAIIEEPLLGCEGYDRRMRRRRVEEVLELVGLSDSIHGSRRPRELSGGECQRVAIARALAPDPKLIICDEAVSSLDVVVQAQIVRLLKRLSEQVEVSYLFISHDLALVRHISDRVAVMYRGQLCEIGDRDSIFDAPAHPYTAALVAVLLGPRGSRPRPGARPARVPDALVPSGGCRYRGSCPRASEVCGREAPALRPVGENHLVACHFPQKHPSPVAALPLRAGSCGSLRAMHELPIKQLCGE